MSALWPLESLEITGERLVLRPVLEADLAPLLSVFPDDFDLDPSYPPLAGLDPAMDRRRLFAQSIWRHRGCWTVDEWALDLGVWRGPEPIGVQTLEGTSFPRQRTVDSASWIAKPLRGNGFGIEARAIALDFAFAALGARRAITSAASTNAASLGVSRHLGYAALGESRHDTGSGVITLAHLELERAEWLERPDRVRARIGGFAAGTALFGF